MIKYRNGKIESWVPENRISKIGFWIWSRFFNKPTYKVTYTVHIPKHAIERRIRYITQSEKVE